MTGYDKMTPTFWNNFKLLMWKNRIIKLRHKKELIIEIVVPLIFCSLLLLIRRQVPLPPEPLEQTFSPVGVDNLDDENYERIKYSDQPKLNVAYTPVNSITSGLINQAMDPLHVTAIGFENADNLESFMMTNNSLCGVVFELDSTKTLPKKLVYSLRFPAILRESNFRKNWLTNRLTARNSLDELNLNYDSDGAHGYISEGFIAIQNAISLSFIKIAAGRSAEAAGVFPDIAIQRFPYPPFAKDDLGKVIEHLLAIVFLLSFVYPVNQIVKHVTIEKENQLKETMKIMGLTTAHHWTAWFCTMFIWMALLNFVIVCMLKIPVVESTAVFTFSSFTLLYVFLLLYSCATITFCFMISTFFKKASVAGAVAGILWFITYIPYTFTIDNFVELSIGKKMLTSLGLNSALAFGFRSITELETYAIGAGWSNLFYRNHLRHNLSLGHVFIMLIVDAVIFMLITLYVEKVKPGSYGVPAKWYFPFTKDYWSPKKKSTEFLREKRRQSSLDTERFELDPGTDNKPAGIQLSNLSKTFGGNVAVDNLNLELYENEITVLLGHNGAGKTTTISMITGYIPSTSGTIIVNGTDVSENLPLVRKYLGVCPQHNILFDDLTVREHVIFYSRLKGLNEREIEAEVFKYLNVLQLTDKRDALSKTLSGGMKRKLSLGVSLCGNSKVVLCDEPSSGMDPQARRALWDLLESEKKGRTILLTTHFMDEADVLGDRIAIMSHGKLICCGTPFFLKKKLGTGYQLICNKGPECRTDKVTTLLRKYISDIEPKTDVGTELSYRLPENYASIFENLLKELEDSQSVLGLYGYGISMTTLEDVFMKTGSETEMIVEKDEFTDGNVSLLMDDSKETVSGVQLYRYQFHAMFLKKLILCYRNWNTVVIQLLIPALFLIIPLQSIGSDEHKPNLPSLPITLDSYGATKTILSTPMISSSEIAKSYGDMFNKYSDLHLLHATKSNMNEEILTLGMAPLAFFEKHNYIVAATITSTNVIAWFNHQAFHTAPLALNLVHNAIAKSILGPDYSISVTNSPLPFMTIDQQQAKIGVETGFVFALNMVFAMSFVSAIFIMFPIRERESRAKLMQFASGVKSIVFWSTHLFFDLLFYAGIGIAVALIMLAYQVPGFRNVSELGTILGIFLLYGFSSLPFTYLMSLLFSTPTTGLSRLSVLNIFIGIGLLIVSYTLKSFGQDRGNVLYENLADLFLVLPSNAFATALFNQAMIVSGGSICSNKVNRCPAFDPECCISAEIKKIVLCLIGSGLAYFILLLVLERYCRYLLNITKLWRPALPALNHDVDDDVRAEQDHVSTMRDDEIVQKTLVMRGLTKYYKKFLAVNQLSLSIEHGECFGLLGVNGAGKTSAFKMLAGDEHISYGDVWIEGFNTKDSMSKIYEMIGYCPQFDALLLDLTGRETLKIFSLVRGIPIHTVDNQISRLAKDLAFERSLNKKVLEYSGGNRRKLSTAVALLGNPQVVYLDEPTAGIDPASRRKLWDMICFVRDLGKGIVLTSHSMEECEALCTRIAIMVNGEFRCLGSTQHLKDKFSKGISLTIKIKKIENNSSMEFGESSNSNPEPDQSLKMNRNGKQVYDFIRNQFPGAVLKENNPRLLTFEIPPNILPYSKIFGLMETNKHALNIEDYALSQATLEQIFLRFAEQQRTTDNKNGLKHPI